MGLSILSNEACRVICDGKTCRESPMSASTSCCTYSTCTTHQRVTEQCAALRLQILGWHKGMLQSFHCATDAAKGMCVRCQCHLSACSGAPTSSQVSKHARGAQAAPWNGTAKEVRHWQLRLWHRAGARSWVTCSATPERPPIHTVPLPPAHPHLQPTARPCLQRPVARRSRPRPHACSLAASPSTPRPTPPTQAPLVAKFDHTLPTTC